MHIVHMLISCSSICDVEAYAVSFFEGEWFY